MSFKIKSNRIKVPYCGKNKNRSGSLKSSVMNFVSKNKRASAEDKLYLNWLHEQNYGCFVCGGHNGIEWHHVKLHSSDKKDHTKLIPLCGVEHHRLGQTLSAHGTPKKWREAYSMEKQNEVADKIYADYLAEKA